jgi:hypothetical protein
MPTSSEQRAGCTEGDEIPPPPPLDVLRLVVQRAKDAQILAANRLARRLAANPVPVGASDIVREIHMSILQDSSSEDDDTQTVDHDLPPTIEDTITIDRNLLRGDATGLLETDMVEIVVQESIGPLLPSFDFDDIWTGHIISVGTSSRYNKIRAVLMAVMPDDAKRVLNALEIMRELFQRPHRWDLVLTVRPWYFPQLPDLPCNLRSLLQYYFPALRGIVMSFRATHPFAFKSVVAACHLATIVRAMVHWKYFFGVAETASIVMTVTSLSRATLAQRYATILIVRELAELREEASELADLQEDFSERVWV